MDLASTIARLPAGAVLSVPPGTYSADLVLKVPNCTLRAEPGTVTIKGGVYGIRILDGVTGTVIEGLTFVGQSKNAVYVKALCHRTTVRDCHIIKPGGSGILTANAHEVNLQGNVIEGGADHGIYASQSGDRGQITGCTVKDCATSAIQVNAHQPNQKKGDPSQDGLSDGWLISGNTVEGCGAKGGSALNLLGLVNSVVESNTVRNQRGGGGVALDRDAGGGLPCRNVTLRHNRISAPHHGVKIGKGSVDCSCDSTNEITGNPPHDWQEKVRTA